MSPFKREDGQGLIEYALVLILVSIVVIAILALLGPQVNEFLTGLWESLPGGN